MSDPAIYELECSVIGAVLLRNDNLSLLPSLEPTHFMHAAPRLTWDAIRRLENKGQPIDTVTIGDDLVRAGATVDERVWAFLGDCAARVPTPDNAIEYARRIKDNALRRRLLESLGEVLEAARAGEHTGADLLTMALAGLSILDAEQPERARTIGDVIKRRMAQLDEIAKEKALGHTSLSGFPTGISVLDEKIGGWQPGIVSLVAARPGMGKSSLGLATADASSASVGVHVFSLEDTEQAYADRTMARTSGVSAEAIRNCTLSAVDMREMSARIPSVASRTRWLFDDRSGISAQEVVRSVRRQRKANGTKVAIVDYVQLLTKPHPRMTAHEALTESITVLADAAKQDGIAYVVLSQLNRDIEKREDKRPQLADLRESGSLEERAKCVVGLYRGAYYGKAPKRGIDFPHDGQQPTKEEFERQVQLIVLKNNNGRTGTVRASWHGPTTRME